MADTVGVVKKVYLTFGSGDTEAWKALMDPQLVFTVSGSLPHSGTFYGADDVVENCFSKLAESFPGFVVKADAFYASGDTVLVECECTAENLQGGGYTGIHKMTVVDGKITRFQDFYDTQKFAAAL